MPQNSIMPEEKRVPATRIERNPNFDLRFPPLPKTVLEVSTLLSEQGDVPDTPKLVETVHEDPVVAALVLRRINSAYYGLRREVSDVPKAVNLLGFDEVCEIVLSAGMMKLKDILKTQEQVDIFNTIMIMSVGTARFMRKISTFIQLAEKGSAYTIGLLHIIGRLVLLYNRPHDYEALWKTNDLGYAPSSVSEQIIFGTDHAQLAAMAAESWLLPNFLVNVLQHYLTPGHLSDHSERVLALALSVAAEATEQYCMEEVEEEKAREFEPPAAIHTFARTVQVDVREIITFIENESEEINRYSRNMVFG